MELRFPAPGMIYNGTFAVLKDGDSQRDITDARPFNRARGGVPLPVSLPSPADFARLQIEPGDKVVTSSLDISNMYHNFRTPAYGSTP